MSQARSAQIVTDFDGLRGTIEASPEELNRSGQEQVLVRFENGQQVSVPADKLIERQDGSFFLPFSISQPERRQAGRDGDEETLIVPVVAEKLEVEKRWRFAWRVAGRPEQGSMIEVRKFSSTLRRESMKGKRELIKNIKSGVMGLSITLLLLVVPA